MACRYSRVCGTEEKYRDRTDENERFIFSFMGE
jgi:hypothetical protein